MKILLLDIETAPNLAYVWGLWEQNVPISQIHSNSYVLCWAAKWLGEKEILFDSVKKSKHKTMLKGIHKLLSEADAVVHYNGARFDVPTLNKEFLLHEMAPPPKYQQIDMLRVAKRVFKFQSNKLDYVSQILGLGKKTRHEGHELWVKCMALEDAAWSRMERYNKNDVVLLEKVYKRMLPWIPGHPNRALYQDDKTVCPSCGSKHFQARGMAVAQRRCYQRYQCTACSTWFKSVNAQPLEKGQQRFAA